MSNEKPIHSELASSPCFAHELDGNGSMETVSVSDANKSTWRSVKRKELIAARLALPVPDRKRVAEEVAGVLNDLIDFSVGPIISLYWPFRGELNLREWMKQAHQRGARIALPVVEAKSQALLFREWMPDCKMAKGIWNIPIPSDTDSVTPTIVISPLVGHDPECYRLGYGGGYFDRTLAALSPRPLVIGVGHACSAIPSIYPHRYDIPMDIIITGKNSVKKRSK